MAKRALLVGCNYPGTDSELNGCINDVMRVKKTLLTRFGFDERDIVVMIDTDKSYPQPTGANIRKALSKIAEDTVSGDVLFMHYSGHGTRIPPESGEDEDTGFDECIVPTDMNLLSDNDFRDVVDKLPSGVLFTFVADCCHSGGLIDSSKQQIGKPGEGAAPAAQPVSRSRDFHLPAQKASEGRSRGYHEEEEEPHRGRGRFSSNEEEERPQYGRQHDDGRSPYGRREDEGERPPYGRPHGRDDSDDDKPKYGRSSKNDSDDDKPKYGRSRRDDSDDDKPKFGRSGHQPNPEGYGRRPEAEAYGRHPEAEGYGRRPEAEGYGRRPEAEGYGRHPEAEGYGRRPEVEEYGRHGRQEPHEEEKYGRPKPPYTGGYSSGKPHGLQIIHHERYALVKNRSMSSDLVMSMISSKFGFSGGAGGAGIRTALYSVFGKESSPMVQMFVGIALSQAPKLLSALAGKENADAISPVISVLSSLLGEKPKTESGGGFFGLFGGHKEEPKPAAAEGGDISEIIGKLTSGEGGAGLGGLGGTVVTLLQSQLQGGGQLSSLSNIIQGASPLVQEVAQEGDAKKAHAGWKPSENSLKKDMGVLISGCQTDETSADADPDGNKSNAYGALSNAIQEVLDAHDGPILYRDLVLQVRQKLTKDGFSQHPGLFCSDGNVEAYYICN